MWKRHFNDKINATRWKNLKSKNVTRVSEQRLSYDIQSSSWFVTWRKLHNVQAKKALYHAEMSVKYCFKASYLNARIHNDKE